VINADYKSMRPLQLIIPNDSVVQSPHVSPVIRLLTSASLNFNVMSELNHLILSHSSGGSQDCKYFAAPIASWMLSKKMRNFCGTWSAGVQPVGTRNARSMYDEREYLIFQTQILIFGQSVDIWMIKRFSERI